jgi:uncharacterized membrane protein
MEIADMNTIRLGIALVIMGFIMIFAGALFSGAQFGGVVMIGPVPLIFGSSPGMNVISMVLAIILMILYLICNYSPLGNSNILNFAF